MTINHYRNVDTEYGLHVLTNNGVDSYLMEDGVHSPKWYKFCADYVPEFPDDSLIQWMTFERRPSCLNVKDHDLGFQVMRYNGVAVKYSLFTRR